ncbi:hypothetical protein HPP92_027844, partial [Vanilla planifolia]
GRRVWRIRGAGFKSPVEVFEVTRADDSGATKAGENCDGGYTKVMAFHGGRLWRDGVMTAQGLGGLQLWFSAIKRLVACCVEPRCGEGECGVVRRTRAMVVSAV